MIVQLGGLNQLIRQMASPNVEVQCNAVGCITNLATHGKLYIIYVWMELLKYVSKMKTSLVMQILKR